MTPLLLPFFRADVDVQVSHLIHNFCVFLYNMSRNLGYWLVL